MPNLQETLNKKTTRREFLFEEVPQVIRVLTGLAAIFSTGWLTNNLLEALFDTPYEKYLFFENGKFIFTDKPSPVRIEFTLPERRIFFRPKPQAKPDGPIVFFTTDIKATHAAWVFGASYQEQAPNEENPNNLKIPYKGTEFHGGLWYVLTDKNGNLIDPGGTILKKPETPFFIEANFIKNPCYPIVGE